eukprot:TRINITY_DN370_c0_g1_i1.p2 TRINITY_DN370_c0_g1~~TRINITY_DN370_c0_g1_i1.p2  ORF type:complete len:124 (+),score=3.10 TRINITY_DN370_c0_g1_i1:47-418(+)
MEGDYWSDMSSVIIGTVLPSSSLSVDKELFEDKILSEEFSCSVCYCVTSNMMETACGHFVCATCYLALPTKKCPIDNQPTNANPITRFIIRKIEGLTLQCEYSKDCDWVGSYSHYKDHQGISF